MGKKLRRTMLYIPGNNPGMIQNAATFGADSVLLDLEDSVSLNRKIDARTLVCQMLKFVRFGTLEVTVRINALNTEFYMDDFNAIIPCRPDAIRLPKAERKADILEAEAIIAKLEKEHGLPEGKIELHAMIETALGIENAFEIATATPRLTAITIGGQDLTADMGVVKTEAGEEISYARRRIVMAAKAAKIDALDTIYAEVDNEAGLIQETKMIKEMGFDGKAIIHPRQIEPIHRVYTPTDLEIVKAKQIVQAYLEAQKEGLGVFAIDGKMIDAPVVSRAHRILDYAGITIGGDE